jgi:hypothetical protein
MSHADRIAPDPRHARAAARMRALRQRERAGDCIVQVKVRKQDTEYLANVDLLRPDQLEDRRAIAIAIEALFPVLIEKLRRDASLSR